MRAYSAGHFELQIDGMSSTAYVKSCEGGWPKMNVTDEAVGGDSDRIKHGTTCEVDAVQLELGMSQTDFLLKWIADSWAHKFARHDGCIVHGDFHYKAQFQHTFRRCLIEETTFPALDASSKEVAYLKVKLRPEEIELKQGDGKPLKATFNGKQKLWTCSAFRLSLDGLDTSRVNKIDSFTVKQGIKQLATGPMRLPELEPTKIDFPDLKITMSMAYAGSVFDWYDKVVCKGTKDTTAERNGSIEFLSPMRDKTLLRVDLFGVGIKAFNIPKSEANSDQMKRCTFDLYVSAMEIAGDDRYALET
jgi:hypothetical protein